MKVRTGFVSNSSSSSFCAFGVAVGMDEEELTKLGMVFTEDDRDSDGYIDEMGEIIYNAADGCNLKCTYDYDSTMAYVGLEYPDMADDETMGQFKERAKVAVKKMFPNIQDDAFGHIEESWSQ